MPRLRLRIRILRASSGVMMAACVGELEYETLLLRLLLRDLLVPGLVLHTEFFRLLGPEYMS